MVIFAWRLAEELKRACPVQVTEMLSHCWLSVVWNETGNSPGWCCGIYAPMPWSGELEEIESSLAQIGQSVGIQWTTVVAIDSSYLSSFRYRAIQRGTLESWQQYLEIQYILS